MKNKRANPPTWLATGRVQCSNMFSYIGLVRFGPILIDHKWGEPKGRD